MRIDWVIHSSDSNPFYLEFWPLVSYVWKRVFGVNPVLLYVDEDHTIPIDETHGMVVKIKPVPDVPKYLQCLWVRYWWPSQVPDKVCMISDIDMFPLSRRYFINQIASIPDDKYVHLNADGAVFPSCYHVAKGWMFRKVLELHPTWEESIRYIYSSGAGSRCNVPTLENVQQWGADEEHATNKIRAYKDPSVFVFFRRTNYLRLDRSFWYYDPNEIKKNTYADAHSIRPYSDPQNKGKIDKLVEEIKKYCRNSVFVT